MARIVRDYDPRPVAEFPVAPHRYRYNGDAPDPQTYDEWRAQKHLRYAEGDVVYLDMGKPKPVKALVYVVHPERSYHGHLREKYKVQVETAKGVWSKDWVYTHPGPIQRGYRLAGLAPEYKEQDDCSE